MSEDLFISHLHSLPTLAKFDSGQIAAYRRACGQRLAESKGCENFSNVSNRPADFLTVTLAAQYSSEKIAANKHHKGKQNIGAAWAAYCKARNPEEDPHQFYRRRQEALANGNKPPNIPCIHERFRTLLDADLELDGTGELAYRLRGLVRMLVAEDIPIDVIQLAHDLRGWRAESRFVQERWAKAFYAPPFVRAETENDQDDLTTPEDELQDQEEEDNAD
jgi:CRISPR type I-E-associated protein CasB/Cse2